MTQPLDSGTSECDDGSLEPDVRRAEQADRDAVANIITLAFENDPLWSRALARTDGDTEHHGAFWRILVENALRYPESWITAGGEATSIWIPPGGTEMSAAEEGRLHAFVVEHLGASADACIELMACFETAHPRDQPHFYLSLLGTHPDHRGRGIGMELLAANLALIDLQHLPAYLESSNPANNDRYARVGFEAVGGFSYPGGGPEVTTMWRAAR
jgi:GNAT superfamily N-acetyltransferase